MRKKGVFGALPAIVLLSLCSLVGLILYNMGNNEDSVFISHESGIYSESFELSIKCMKPGKIVYTMNGEKPALDNENILEYTKPLLLECKEETTTYSFQICCFFSDGTQSEIYKRDFILDLNGKERFTTTYVVSIVGDESKLFGDKEGIFVRGNRYYEYVEQNPAANPLEIKIPANYYVDTEVPVHAAIFTSDGKLIIDQNCGIKIYGFATRQHNQKSFKLCARYDYDDKNEFKYTFFKNSYSENGNYLIDEWQRLAFHNSGTDHDQAYVRSELIERLAAQAGVDDILDCESVTVYINGKYQGVYWLQNTYDDKYFKEKYGNYLGEMVVCEGTLNCMDVNETSDISQEKFCQDYNKFCEWISTADMTDNDNWEKVCNTIDIENFAQYFAIQYYIGNLDWPENNVKVFRYKCAEGETYKEGTVFDGKYRYLLFDLDYGLGLKFLDFFGYSEDVQRLDSFLSNDETAVIFKQVMQRQEFEDIFVQNVMCLLNKYFAEKNVSDVLYKLNLSRYDELKYMIEETDILRGSIWEKWGVGHKKMSDVENRWNDIVLYARNRPQYVALELQQVLNYGDLTGINVSLLEQGKIKIGYIDVGQEMQGVWFYDVPINLSCELSAGMQVIGYQVNSEYIEGEVLHYIPKQESALLEIVPIIVTNEMEKLEIVEYKIDSTDDYVVLQNVGTVVLNLADYSISDESNDASKGKLPSVQLEPGEQYWVYGKKYSQKMKKDSVQVTFSWNDEESVHLFHR